MKITHVVAPTIIVALVGSVALAAPPAPVAAAGPAAKPAIRPAGSSPKLQAVTASPEVLSSLRAKKKKPQVAADIAKVLSYQGDTPLLQIAPGKMVSLDAPDKPGPTEAEITAAKTTLPVAMRRFTAYMVDWKGSVAQYQEPQSAVGGAPPIPKSDHRPMQSAVRDQASRNTCSAHAAVSALEARLRKNGAPHTIDLSENHAFNLFSMLVMKPCTMDEGVPAWKTGGWLTSTRICTEAESPYVPNEQTGNCATIQSACQNNKRHGFTLTFPLFGKDGGGGFQSINSTNVLEAWIDQGFDIVGGFHLAGNDWSDATASSGVIDVQMSGGSPAESYGGHAMLVVGYDRPGQYFILKNSWGTGWGHAGYAYVSYDYIRTYARYGYVVMEATNW